MSDETTTDTTTKPTTTTAVLFTLARDGNRPLRFRGELIGTGEHGSGGNGYRCDWNRGVKVYIYRRASGGYVVARVGWSQWQGEHGTSEAAVCKDAAAVLAELHRDEYGDEPGGSIIPPAEAEALADAAGSDEQIAAVSVEDLDE